MMVRHDVIPGLLLVVIDIEKVRVKQGLDNTRKNGNGLEGTLERSLGEVSEHPVGNVECPVEAQRKQIVGGDCVRLSSSLQHEELRQDRNGFQPD